MEQYQEKFRDMLRFLRSESYEVNQQSLRTPGLAQKHYLQSRSTYFGLAADLIEHCLKGIQEQQKLISGAQSAMAKAEVAMKETLERSEFATDLLHDCRPIIEAHAAGATSPDMQKFAELMRERIDGLMGQKARV